LPSPRDAQPGPGLLSGVRPIAFSYRLLRQISKTIFRLQDLKVNGSNMTVASSIRLRLCCCLSDIALDALDKLMPVIWWHCVRGQRKILPYENRPAKRRPPWADFGGAADASD
jgi:hypothetical protein